MSKKTLGILGIVGGLGLASFLLYFFLAKEGLFKQFSPKPPAESSQESVSPAPEAPQKPEASASSQPANFQEPTPPASGPAAPPPVVPVPTPEPPPTAEKTVAPAPKAEPKKEHGLLVGKFKHYKQAQRLQVKLQKQKVPGFIRKEGKYYKVWAGPFPTPEAAAQAQKKLRAGLKISPKVGKLAMPGPK